MVTGDDAVTDRAIPRNNAGAHFAGLPVALDARPWRTRYPGGLLIGHNRLEQVLEDHLAGLGVIVRRLHDARHGRDGTAVAGCAGSGCDRTHRLVVGLDEAALHARHREAPPRRGRPAQRVLLEGRMRPKLRPETQLDQQWPEKTAARTRADAGTRTPNLPLTRRPICVDHGVYQALQCQS